MTEQGKDQNWTEVISPKNNLFDIRLREVWRYRDLLFLFVKRDIAAQYKQTILGPLWFVIQPVFTTIVFFLLFSKLAGIPTDGVPQPIFYMCSISAWNYFSMCFISTSTTFTANAGIFGKVYFPRLVMPLSIIVSNILKFGIQLLLLFAIILYYVFTGGYSFHIGANTLLFPFIIIIMAAMGLGFGIIISSLTTKYRDLSILITFGVQLLMYITPVAYSLGFVVQKHPQYQTLIQLNPLSSLIEAFRYSVLGVGYINYGWLAYSCICAVVALFAGILVFNKVERSFMDTV